jgi:hypothetical protein
MVVFIATGLLVGGLLGTRFTIGALIPATVLALAATALGWALHGNQWSVLPLITLLVFLQIGYVCGAALRLIVVPLEMVRPRKPLRRGS